YLEASQPEAVGRRARYRAMKVPRVNHYDYHGFEQPLRSLLSAYSMEEAIRELLDTAEPLPGDQDLFDLENRLALLHLMATALPDDKPVYLWIRGFPEGQNATWTGRLAQLYFAWSTELGVEMARNTPVDPKFSVSSDYLVQLKGIHARPLALTEAGTHLFLPKHGGPVPVRVDVVGSWPATLLDPFAFGPIVRVYPEGQAIADVRTGLVNPPPYSPEVFRTFTLAALPRS